MARNVIVIGKPLQVSKAAGEGLVAGQSAAKYVADLKSHKGDGNNGITAFD